MKKVIFILSVVAMSLAACKKNEETKVVAGTKIHSGSLKPTPEIGGDGDFFLDTTTDILWGPKKGTSWGAGIALTGNTVLNGSGAPEQGTGMNGDFYLDIATQMLYGPKKDGVWPSGVSLKGTSADVIYSSWVKTTTNSSDTIIDGTCMRIRYMGAKSLSNEVLNSGVIITYFRVGPIGVYQLPYTAEAGGATSTINAIYSEKKIAVYRHTHNNCRYNSGISPSYAGQPVMVNLPQSLEFRYIIIPGITAGGTPSGGVFGGNDNLVTIKGTNETIDLSRMSYAEVCARFNIPE